MSPRMLRSLTLSTPDVTIVTRVTTAKGFLHWMWQKKQNIYCPNTYNHKCVTFLVHPDICLLLVCWICCVVGTGAGCWSGYRRSALPLDKNWRIRLNPEETLWGGDSVSGCRESCRRRWGSVQMQQAVTPATTMPGPIASGYCKTWLKAVWR